MIYDPVGGPYAEAALRSIAWGGRFLVIGFAAGEIPRIPLNLVLLKGCDIAACSGAPSSSAIRPANRANNAELVRWSAAGQALRACARGLSAGADAEALRAMRTAR